MIILNVFYYLSKAQGSLLAESPYKSFVFSDAILLTWNFLNILSQDSIPEPAIP